MENLILCATLAVAIFAVSVPEGLPMAVAIAFSYSLASMKADSLMAKDLSAPETMGSVDEICTGKTATLTKEEMSVDSFHISGTSYKNKKLNTFAMTRIPQQTVELIQEGIMYNSDIRIEIDNHAMYTPIGNPTDQALVKFLLDNKYEAHNIIKQALGRD